MWHGSTKLHRIRGYETSTHSHQRAADALEYRDGGLAVCEHLVSQLPRRRDNAADGKRAAAVPFLGGARGYYLLPRNITRSVGGSPETRVERRVCGAEIARA